MNMKKITVFAPTHPDTLHDGIVELFHKKTGCKIYHSHDRAKQWIVVDSVGDIVGNNYKPNSRREVSIKELSEMPDYKFVKEMTLPEIIKELGYEVKIVK